MTVYFVSRHPGAREWAARRGLADAVAVEHLDPGRVEAGDTLIGTLPINIVAAAVARGARYLHLTLDLHPDMRGRELTADDMERAGARLQPMTAAFLP